MLGNFFRNCISNGWFIKNPVNFFVFIICSGLMTFIISTIVIILVHPSSSFLDISILSSIFSGITILRTYILNEYENAYKKIKISDAKKSVEIIRERVREIKKIESFKAILEEESKVKDKLEKEINNNISHSQHLSNVISGINHEISPWIGGISNMISRLNDNMTDSCNNTLGCSFIKNRTSKKYAEILKACEQAMNILTSMSVNVRKVQTYSIDNYSVKDTVESWCKLVLMDRHIKESLNENNIEFDGESLDYIAKHSPMLLSQIVLNLAKNSVEHNIDRLDNLRIKIYGDKNLKYLIYSDNGQGVPSEFLTSIFKPGFTTRKDKSHHGFGLTACKDYCLSMDAIISCESEVGKYTRFIIKFESTETNEYKSDIHEKIKIDKMIQSFGGGGGHE